MTEHSSVEVFSGGVPADTEIMTCSGPRSVADVDPGERVYALDVSTQIVKLKGITDVASFEYSGQLVHPEARRVDLRLHPEHRLPYQTESIDRVRFARAGDLEARVFYHFINDWRTMSARGSETIDITDFTDEFVATASYDSHGKTFRAKLPDGCEPIKYNWQVGFSFDSETFKEYQDTIESMSEAVYVRSGTRHHRRPYRFDVDAFIRFLGWFVTEGSVSWSSESDTARITITQEKQEYQEQIKSLFDRLGFEISKSGKDYQFSSVLYAEMLERWCGTSSKERELPDFVWDLGPRHHRRLMDTLLKGDGNGCDTYYTTSSSLRDDIMRLCVEIGVKPRYSSNRGVWRLFTARVNDKLDSTKQVSWTDFDGRLYRLTVEDYPVVLLGRDGKFQWVSVSHVA